MKCSPGFGFLDLRRDGGLFFVPTSRLYLSSAPTVFQFSPANPLESAARKIICSLFCPSTAGWCCVQGGKECVGLQPMLGKRKRCRVVIHGTHVGGVPDFRQLSCPVCGSGRIRMNKFRHTASGLLQLFSVELISGCLSREKLKGTECSPVG